MTQQQDDRRLGIVSTIFAVLALLIAAAGVMWALVTLWRFFEMLTT